MKSKIFLLLQFLFIVLIVIYVYQINFEAPLFKEPNLIFILSIFASVFGFLIITIIKNFEILKKYKKIK